MKFRHELAYDAGPDEVYAMLRDPAFRERVCLAQQVVSHDVAVTASGEGFELRMEQVQNTAGLPAIAKKFAGETTQAVVEESWATPAGGTITITAPGKPTGAEGTIELRGDGAGTVELVELEVKVRVPVIGGKLERLMAETIGQGYDIEHTVGQAWLAGER